MNKYNFNYIQNQIVKYLKTETKTDSLYNQTLELQNVYDIDSAIEKYKYLLLKFDILRATIDLEKNNYTILNYDVKYLNIKSTNYYEHKFNYDGSVYLTSLLKNNDKYYLVFHHIFIDGTSLELIHSLLSNKIHENKILNSKKYYLYENIETENLNSDKTFINANLIKRDFNKKNYFSNNLISINLDNVKFDNFIKTNNISSHSFHFGTINLILRIFSDIKNFYSIHNVFNGRSEEYKNSLGFFSYVTEIEYQNIDKLNLKTYFCNTHNAIRNAGKISSTYCNVLINDVRKLNVFKLNVPRGNNDLLCDISVKIIENDKFIFQGNKKYFLNIQEIFQKVYDYVLNNHSLETKIENINFEFKNTLINDVYLFQNPISIFYKNLQNNWNKIAVIEKNNNITYSELYHEAVNFSKLHFKNLKNKTIPIYSSKNIESIIALLAIFISGLSFSVINSNSSYSEILDILQTLNAEILVSNDKTEYGIKKIYPNRTDKNMTNLNMNFLNIPNVTQSDTSYILFTSGSTGKPKGIVQNYGTIYNTSTLESDFYNYETKASLLNFAFDVTVFDIFSSLINCKTLKLFDNIGQIDTLLNIDIISITSTLFNHLESVIKKSNIKTIILTAEKINFTLEQYESFKFINFYNFYGPTEAGIFCSIKKLSSYHEFINQNIGKSIKNMNIIILDKYLNETPNNVIGEICVSGLQIFSGYLDDTLDTNIIANYKYVRLYKTGDYGLINDMGDIEYIGRIDHQIKRNGVRIDLQHIDNVIIKNKNVKQSVSVFKNNKIITIIKLNNVGNSFENDVYDFVFLNLNKNYIPNEIIFTENYDCNTNGKITVKNNLTKCSKTDELVENLKFIILTNFNVNIENPDTKLYFYGFDSMKIIQLTNIMNKSLSLNLQNSLTFESSLNEISKIVQNLLKFVVFENNNGDNLIIIFRDGCRNYITEIKKLPNYDFLIVENYLHIPSKNPFDSNYNIINDYINKNYKKIFIISRCVGCVQAIDFLHVANKVIFDTAIFNKFSSYYDKYSEKINILKQHDEKIFYYFANSKEYKYISILTDQIKLKNLKKIETPDHLYFRNNQLFLDEMCKLFEEPFIRL